MNLPCVFVGTFLGVMFIVNTVVACRSMRKLKSMRQRLDKLERYR